VSSTIQASTLPALQSPAEQARASCPTRPRPKRGQLNFLTSIGLADRVGGAVGVPCADRNEAVNTRVLQKRRFDRLSDRGLDMDETGLERIKDGQQMFAIDLQPYLQGFLAVSLLNSYVNYGLDLPVKPVLTGPGIVNKDNVDRAVAGAKAGAR
jgi:simple sugar transport system substrate-binding protein